MFLNNVFGVLLKPTPVASSRRSVNWGAVRKRTKDARRFSCCAQLTEHPEEATSPIVEEDKLFPGALSHAARSISTVQSLL